MRWYVSREGAVSGPYREEEVIKRIADGNITRSALVSEDPDSEWQPIEASIFESAFGASNPYTNPERTTRKWTMPSNLGAWFAFVVLCALLGVLKAHWRGPKGSQSEENRALISVGTLVAVIGAAYVLLGRKRPD